MQAGRESRVKFRDHAPEAGEALGQFAGVGVLIQAGVPVQAGVPAPGGARGQGNLVDGCPEHGEPCLQSRTHDRSLGRRLHDRDAFRRPGHATFDDQVILYMHAVNRIT
jgi:hypothetical protein